MYSYMPTSLQFSIFIPLTVFPLELNPNKLEYVKHLHDANLLLTLSFHCPVTCVCTHLKQNFAGLKSATEPKPSPIEYYYYST